MCNSTSSSGLLSDLLTERRSLLQAAWIAGSLVNEIRFNAEVSWFCPSSVPRQYRPRWDELHLLVREIVTDERQRDELADLVSEAALSWNRKFNQLAHAELLHSQNCQLQTDLTSPHLWVPDVKTEDIRRHRLGLITYEVTELIAVLLRGLEDSLDDRTLGIFRLGKQFDQLFRPTPAYESMTFADSNIESEIGAQCSIWDHSSSPAQSEWRLPLLPLSPPSNGSPLQLAEIAQRCRQMTLPEIFATDFLGQAGVEGSSHNAIQILGEKVVSYLANDGEEALVAMPPECNKVINRRFQTGLHHFGLRFDEGSGQLSRVGTSEFVFLQRKQPCKLFQFFVEHHEERLTLERLRDNWHVLRIGRESPKDGTIYSAISELGKLILPVRLHLDNKPDFGWVIMDR